MEMEVRTTSMGRVLTKCERTSLPGVGGRGVQSLQQGFFGGFHHSYLEGVFSGTDIEGR